MDSQAAGSDSPQRPGQSLLKRLKLPETPDYVAELAAIPREHRRVMPDNDPRRQSRFGLRRMFARDPTKHDRAATPLELFFDLVFAAAVGIAASTLFDLEETGHFGQATAAFLMVFFSIWLAWDSYTWFASAFDTDDWLYRLCTFVQMAGALVLAAGVKPAMEDFDFAVTTIGYVIMRLALVFQWLRAAVASPWFRPVALSQALAITIVQGLWVTRQLVFHQDRWSFVAFIVLAACEIALPHIAQTKTAIPWHPRHVAERYSLFTLIVFGESVIAAGNAMIDAIYATDDLQPLIIISIGALIIAAGLWWVYFARYQKTDIHTFKRARVFSYVHYALLVSIGAFSAGLECLIDEVEGQGLLTGFRADATVSVPVAFFFLIVWWFFLRKNLRPFHQALGWLGLIVVCLSPLAPEAIIVTAAGVMITVIAVELARVQETADESASEPPVTGDHASASSHHHS